MTKLHLHLFDDGGDGGGEVVEPEVVYGKADDEPTQIENNDEGQTEDLDAEFNELIKGKYKEQYGKAVSHKIQQRFKGAQERDNALREYQEQLKPLFSMYGVDNPTDFARTLQSNDDLFSARAEEAGMTVEQYKERLELQAEAERGRQLQEEIEREREAQAQYDQWLEEAEELTEIFPNFNLEEEANNEQFVNYLEKGLPLKDAFSLCHMNEIMDGVGKDSKSRALDKIKMRNQRPVESGAAKARAVTRKSNVNELTDKDIDEIIRRVSHGEKISF